MNKKLITPIALGLSMMFFPLTALGQAVPPDEAKPKRCVIVKPHIVLEPGPVIMPDKPIVESNKNIEIVFVLDTTGSMGGLIQGAKTKIWSIINNIMQYQKKGTKVKVGLVAYRDRGDDYVTKVTGLSEDLDQVYATLMGFRAGGGGDEPEDVRQALANSLNNIQWGKSKDNLSKIIFLVGDARPHTDYSDQPSTVDTAKKAKKEGIIINTIQCGNLSQTDKYWKEIAQYGGGEYFAIAQNGGTVEIATPYDKDLKKLSDKLDKEYIPYGSYAARGASLRKAEEIKDSMAAAPEEAVAARAINKSINSYSYSSDDLIQGIENGSLKLENLKKEQLPENMQVMTLEEQKVYVNKKIAERTAIREKIKTLSSKRAEYIKNNTPKTVLQSSFDAAVERALEKQIK